MRKTLFVIITFAALAISAQAQNTATATPTPAPSIIRVTGATGAGKIVLTPKPGTQRAAHIEVIAWKDAPAEPVQAFSTTATITLQRNSAVSQAAANQSLSRDIERFILERYSAVSQATAKDNAGACLPFTITEQRANGTVRTINLEVYNRDTVTCLPAIVGNKTDLRSLATLETVLQRAFRLLFDEIADARVAKDNAATAATATSADNAGRVSEKP